MIRFYKLILLLPLLSIHQVGALPSDSEQLIQFQSDRFEMDEIRRTQTYSGAVEMIQGSMKILADKVIIIREDNRVARIIATGQPARYSQVARPGEEPIQASARRMEYDVESKNLQLLEEAFIVQKGSSLSGNRINYDVKRALVKAEGKQQGGADDRVRMIIPPADKEE